MDFDNIFKEIQKCIEVIPIDIIPDFFDVEDGIVYFDLQDLN